MKLPAIKTLAGLALIGDGIRRLAGQVKSDDTAENHWYSVFVPNNSDAAKTVGYFGPALEIAAGLAVIFLIKK